MRIAFVGNQDNNAYRLCKWVRTQGPDAHLYMIRQERGPRSHPEHVDPDLAPGAGGYPDWIHPYDDKGKTWFLRPSRLAREIQQSHDVVVTSGATGLVAANQFRRGPLVHVSLGDEVGVFPLALFKLSTPLPWRGVAVATRLALAKVRRIFTQFRHTIGSIIKMGLQDKMVIWGFPEDTKANVGRVDRQLLAELNRKYSSCRRVFLWLSRVNYLDRATPNYKGPEKFLEALRMVALEEKASVRAIIGTHGNDIEAFQRLAGERGLAGHIDYVPHLPYWKLLTYLAIDNAVVFDELVKEHGEVSGIAREALSVGGVVAKAVDADLVRLCFGEGCPILNAYDVPTARQAMASALASDQEFARLKKAHADWAAAYLHYDRNVSRFIDILRQVVYCGKVRPTRVYS